MMEMDRDERWKLITIENFENNGEYWISSYGRLKRTQTDSNEEHIITERYNIGYPIFEYRDTNNKRRYKLCHRLVGFHFLKKDRDDQVWVMHLNYKRRDNHVDNLKWVSKTELMNHQRKNPKFMATQGVVTASKLTVTEVIRIKKKIFNPKRKTRMKIIAREFGISTMQLYRIKRGENWGHVVVD